MADGRSYIELLRDPRWQRMRLFIMRRDNFACRRCSEKTKTLNVHHSYYVRGKAPWEYPAESLFTLCEDCHERFTLLSRDLSVILNGLPFSKLNRVMEFARALLTIEAPAISPLTPRDALKQRLHDATSFEEQIELLRRLQNT